jgi:hypothetical protein
MEKWLTDKGPGTHVLMDGGILQVPFEQLEEFYLECVHAVRLGKKLYVVEQKTDVFKFFVDLDYKGPEALPDDVILNLVGVMHSVVQKGRCIIARAEPRIVDGQVKTGVHIHWPDVFVTKSEALALRTRILLDLPEDPEWSQRIDASVYGGSGLRMLWSHKREKGIDSKPYVPWRDIEGNVFEPVPSPEILKLFAVRTNEVSNESVNVEITCAPLERYIRKYLKGQELANVRRVMRKASDTIIVQTDSKYCERIQGEHKSNHVWFGIRGELICQLCHDDECNRIAAEKNANNEKLPKRFSGREYILSPSIVDELRSNVAVDNSTYVSIRDLVPDFWWQEESVPQRSAPVLWTRPKNMGTASKSSGGFRKPTKKSRAKSWGTLPSD